MNLPRSSRPVREETPDLLGVGVITLGVQGMRMSFGLTVEGFWLLVGLLFALGGVATLFQVNLPVLPVVLVAAIKALYRARLTCLPTS